MVKHVPQADEKSAKMGWFFDPGFIQNVQRNIAPRMNGTHQSGPHLIDRKRMMEIAKDALEVANAK